MFKKILQVRKFYKYDKLYLHYRENDWYEGSVWLFNLRLFPYDPRDSVDMKPRRWWSVAYYIHLRSDVQSASFPRSFVLILLQTTRWKKVISYQLHDCLVWHDYNLRITSITSDNDYPHYGSDGSEEIVVKYDVETRWFAIRWMDPSCVYCVFQCNSSPFVSTVILPDIMDLV